MAKNQRPEADPPPTMIIPRNTEIQVDAHGQLSIRAPGNLVIQNSGHYGNLESVNGSIRIEPEVEVEAVSVRCPETCYVQGSLTAWKVSAKSLHLEDTAKAHIVLQETQRLEVGKDARLVGNFKSEKELFFLFSRFSNQMRSLPVYRDGASKEDPEASTGRQLLEESVSAPEVEASAPDAPSSAVQSSAAQSSAASSSAASSSAPAKGKSPSTGGSASDDLPEPLFFALMLLERDQQKQNHHPEDRRILWEVVKLLEQGDLETLRHTHRTLFSRVREASEEVQRSRELVEDFFS